MRVPATSPCRSTVGESCSWKTARSIEDSAIDLRYSTIAGNTQSIDCSNSATGVLRNNIIVGLGTSSISVSCFMSFVDNAVDGGFGFGTDVGAYDPAWFVAPGTGDFHLAGPGQATFADIADWDPGDPLVDIDGDPRPQDALGYPGIDEIP
jgi:hypothetical protein